MFQPSCLCVTCEHLELFKVDAAEFGPTLSVPAGDVFAAVSTH
jgi:hypothetical protein